ncbi:hypothetical protein PTTG_25546 [Puccinia triticina 1-1 BBBD Race 1]|uniref:Uncharacterized protein n=1 Tax=Puccinia triticina (isolate 1-1 / race 1 (BBBD)) TaxID=630390 RepID=A0A180H1F8_PUCT1|nr:hypothetical protein PTTG_25546 [Puccinia triticina 1-1 BBBD Race 1]
MSPLAGEEPSSVRRHKVFYEEVSHLASQHTWYMLAGEMSAGEYLPRRKGTTRSPRRKPPRQSGAQFDWEESKILLGIFPHKSKKAQVGSPARVPLGRAPCSPPSSMQEGGLQGACPG